MGMFATPRATPRLLGVTLSGFDPTNKVMMLTLFALFFGSFIVHDYIAEVVQRRYQAMGRGDGSGGETTDGLGMLLTLVEMGGCVVGPMATDNPFNRRRRGSTKDYLWLCVFVLVRCCVLVLAPPLHRATGTGLN